MADELIGSGEKYSVDLTHDQVCIVMLMFAALAGQPGAQSRLAVMQMIMPEELLAIAQVFAASHDLMHGGSPIVLPQLPTKANGTVC